MQRVCELLTENKCFERIVWLAISCKDLYSLLKAKFLPVASTQLPAVGADVALILQQIQASKQEERVAPAESSTKIKIIYQDQEGTSIQKYQYSQIKGDLHNSIQNLGDF